MKSDWLFIMPVTTHSFELILGKVKLTERIDPGRQKHNQKRGRTEAVGQACKAIQFRTVTLPLDPNLMMK